MLVQDILTRHHRALITRAALRAKRREHATSSAGPHGGPALVEQLAKAMTGEDQEIQRLGELASRHGEDLGRRGETLAEVIHLYGDISQAMHELAQELGVSVPLEDLRRMQTLLEDGLTCAATAYERTCTPSAARVVASTRAFEHGLRHLVHLARLALESARLDHDLDTSLVAGPLGRSIHGLVALLERRDAQELSQGDSNPWPNSFESHHAKESTWSNPTASPTT